MASETAAPQEEAPAVETRLEDKRGVSGSSLVVVLEKLGRWTVALLARPRVRTITVGIILILIGALAVSNSFWTFPIVIVGVIMVIVAWVGSRLEGRFAVEWSEEGAGFEMRARFKAADTQLHRHPLTAPPAPTSSSSTDAAVSVIPDISGAETVPDAPETIEGEAHTVEIDVDELKALVAAAEKLARDSTTHDGTPVSWQGTRHAA